MNCVVFICLIIYITLIYLCLTREDVNYEPQVHYEPQVYYEPFITNNDTKFVPCLNEYKIFETDQVVTDKSGQRVEVRGPTFINERNNGIVNSMLQVNDISDNDIFSFDMCSPGENEKFKNSKTWSFI